VLFDRLERARVDAEEEPLAAPPGAASDPSKEPALELEDTEQPAHGDPPGDPSEDPDDPAASEDQEIPDPQLPHPPVTAQPTSPGLDEE
jgi:hypothetical protein